MKNILLVIALIALSFFGYSGSAKAQYGPPYQPPTVTWQLTETGSNYRDYMIGFQSYTTGGAPIWYPNEYQSGFYYPLTSVSMSWGDQHTIPARSYTGNESMTADGSSQLWYYNGTTGGIASWSTGKFRIRNICGTHMITGLAASVGYSRTGTNIHNLIIQPNAVSFTLVASPYMPWTPHIEGAYGDPFEGEPLAWGRMCYIPY